jgi:uncharacterized protein
MRGDVGTDPRPAIERLDAVLRSIGRPLAIAVSGGIDSLTLATVAHKSRGRVAMFHAVSPAVPPEATRRVEWLASEQGWAVSIIEAGEFSDATYLANPSNRCFFCKINLYGSIAGATSAQIVSGANLDDLGEYRPGLDAARDHDVRHPFIEAGIDKATIRALARHVGLGDLAELPASPCLSSRVETGITIRPDVLLAIHRVERRLAADLPNATLRCRVRAAGIVIELDPPSLGALDGRQQIEMRAFIRDAFAGLPVADAIAFAPYRNGSAFLRGAA